MLHDEEMYDVRVNSPSYSDNSSLSGCGLDEMEDLELFPDLKELVSRQVSSDSDVSKENGKDPNKRNIVAVRLDPGKEKELIDYLLGKSESDDSQTKSNGDILQAIHQKVLQRETSVPKSVLQTGGGSSVTRPEYGSKMYAYSSRGEFDGKCMSKNAVAARENRLRKKRYISDLEQTVSSLSSENVNLKKQVTSMQQTVGDLKTEVKYLRSVLANQSTLSALLKNIPSVPGINLKTSVSSEVPNKLKGRKRQRGDDSDEENIDSNIQVDEHDDIIHVAEEVTVGGDNDLDFDIGMMSTVGMCTRGRVAKDPKLDHSYATNNSTMTQYQKRNQIRAQERNRSNVDTGAGVCLHVNGSKVSLEFCSQCSRKASTEEREVS